MKGSRMFFIGIIVIAILLFLLRSTPTTGNPSDAMCSTAS